METALYTLGHDFVGRYRVLEILGVGHTAEVYLTHDGRLARQVVVKTLRTAIAEHEEARRDFRDRIVAASRLTSPHIARVFDGGQERGVMYVITEYLSGGSLEDLLDKRVFLSIEDVARLGRDVARALVELHEAGLVHGNLSPAKLLFDDEGMVRVSDVTLAGLAEPYRRRTTRDEVRYLSPEQADGAAPTSVSDVYALALLLFEAATGQAPFESSTAEGSLQARRLSTLPSRPELGTLDLLLAQATVPDPSQRLSAAQFADRLDAIVGEGAFLRPRDEAPSLLGAYTPSAPRSQIGFRPPSPEEIAGLSAAPIVASTPPRRPAVPFEESTPLEPVRRRRPGFALAALAIVLVTVAAAGAWRLGYFTPTHAVPNVVGQTQGAAARAVDGDGLTLNISAHVNSATVPVGDVVSQSPNAGTTLKSNAAVTVTISMGPATVTLPTSLVGSTCAADEAALAGLKVTVTCPASAQVTSSRTGAGLVAAVAYGKTMNPLAVPTGAVLVLDVSKGAGTSNTTTSTVPVTKGHVARAVPNVVGVSRAQVNTLLGAAGLYYSTKGPGADSPSWTRVLSTIPAVGTTVPWHSTIILNVTDR
jgi:serine/threonine-protein kinase